MSLINKITTNNLPTWPLFPAIIVACLLNYYCVSFFAGSELIFGNVIAVVVLFIYGLIPAVVISVVAGVVTYLNWGNLFSIPPFLLEILALHWAIKTKRNPVYFGMVYWVTVGWVLVGFEFVFLSNFELLSKYAITIKYFINGLLNVLIGCRIAQFVFVRRWFGEHLVRQEISAVLTNRLFYIVTVAVIIISFYWLNAFEREKLYDYQDLLQMKANHVSIELEHQISGHQKSLILTALSNINASNPAEIQPTLENLRKTYPSITTLMSTDKDGEVVASAPADLLKTISASGQTNVADRSYFYEVKKSGKPYVSDVFRGRGFGNASIIAISAALTNDEEFIGIIEASIDITLLEEVDKKEIAADEGIIILDRNHRVIYASKHLGYGFLDDLSEFKLIKHLSAPDAYYIKDEVGNNLIVKSADSEFLGWKTISTLPLSVYDASINRNMIITLSLLGLFIILSFQFATWAVQIVTQPINKLSSALSEAENSEDLLALSLTTGNRELIEISNVEEKLKEFAIRSKQLMSDLKQANLNQDIANEKLLDLNLNLEQIVNAKTKELNNALKIANDANDEKDVAKNIAEHAARGKTDFLANMSHEIRTPMNGVLGMAQLLSATSLTVTQKDYVESILSSGNLLLTIINDVLVYSKLEAGKVELEVVPINLEHLLHEVLEVMSWSLVKDIELVLNYPATMPTIFMGDPARLSQVLFNLVDNAIKFTEQGSISILARFDGQLLTLEVIDTGIGITEKQQEILFESFNQADTSTTRKYGGTGLGLAICKKIISLMDGKITIQSEYGKGTRFIISLNLAAEEKPEPEAIFDKINVLLIEDNNHYFSLYADLLSHHGATVTQCTEIDSMIDTLLYAHEKESAFHLVLLSSNISSVKENKYGLELRTHPRLKNIPLIIFSPSSNKASLEHYLLSGFSAYLTKPIRSDLLNSVLKEALENKDSKALITKHSISNYSQPSAINIQFKGHILLVEDVLTNQVVATTMLKNMGLIVDLAEDGLQAITKWQNKHYDLIFMDCRMPNMDGYEATKYIREKELGSKIPIIALTANVTEEDRIKCDNAGMNAVVMKPFKPSDLHDVLSKWLNAEGNVIEPSEAVPVEAPLDTEIVVDTKAIVDLETFENTQQLLGDAFPELLESIFCDIDSILDKLSNWADPLDIDGLALLPHSMKSSSAYIGAMKLNQLAADCEREARAGKVEKALSYVIDMKETYEAVTSCLAELGHIKPN